MKRKIRYKKLYMKFRGKKNYKIKMPITSLMRQLDKSLNRMSRIMDRAENNND